MFNLCGRVSTLREEEHKVCSVLFIFCLTTYISVAIVDDGLDFNHQDIAGNYAPIGSTDINFHKADPMPFAFDGHGTSAAGFTSFVFNMFCFSRPFFCMVSHFDRFHIVFTMF
jgi:hypothetical protein